MQESKSHRNNIRPGIYVLELGYEPSLSCPLYSLCSVFRKFHLHIYHLTCCKNKSVRELKM